jgi:hypothetical protein
VAGEVSGQTQGRVFAFLLIVGVAQQIVREFLVRFVAD